MQINYSNLLLANYSLLNQLLHEKIKSSELSPGQPKVLNFLLDNNGATHKEVAAGCYLTPGALSTILKKMEKQKMIERRKEQGNNKEIHIYMTEKGKTLSKQAEEIFRELEARAMASLSEEEKEVFMTLFEKIYLGTV